MLTIQNACKSYEGAWSWNSFAWHFLESGTVCLFGPFGVRQNNSAFNCIAGLEKLDSGAFWG